MARCDYFSKSTQPINRKFSLDVFRLGLYTYMYLFVGGLVAVFIIAVYAIVDGGHLENL